MSGRGRGCDRGRRRSSGDVVPSVYSIGSSSSVAPPWIEERVRRPPSATVDVEAAAGGDGARRLAADARPRVARVVGAGADAEAAGGAAGEGGAAESEAGESTGGAAGGAAALLDSASGAGSATSSVGGASPGASCSEASSPASAAGTTAGAPSGTTSAAPARAALSLAALVFLLSFFDDGLDGWFFRATNQAGSRFWSTRSGSIVFQAALRAENQEEGTSAASTAWTTRRDGQACTHSKL